jgi:hypothetical protein
VVDGRKVMESGRTTGREAVGGRTRWPSERRDTKAARWMGNELGLGCREWG